MTGQLATRLCGSADLNERLAGRSLRSINLITAYDELPLYDLVSYRQKRNEANDEEGRDGREDEFGDNCDVEGASAHPDILRRRLRRMKNFLATLVLSRGLATHAEMEHFVRLMIAFRRRHEVLRRGAFYAPSETVRFGPDGRPPVWSEGDIALGCILAPAALGHAAAEGRQPALCLLFNAARRRSALRFRRKLLRLPGDALPIPAGTVPMMSARMAKGPRSARPRRLW